MPGLNLMLHIIIKKLNWTMQQHQKTQKSMSSTNLMICAQCL